jgi:hypothetical protein
MNKMVNGVLVAMTDAEIATMNAAADSIQPDIARAKRDELLAASDTMALADRITDEWRTYRQNLRDLPAAEGFPDVTFPVAPS